MPDVIGFVFQDNPSGNRVESGLENDKSGSYTKDASADSVTVFCSPIVSLMPPSTWVTPNKSLNESVDLLIDQYLWYSVP